MATKNKVTKCFPHRKFNGQQMLHVVYVYECLLAPLTVPSTIPPRCMKSEHTFDAFRGKCPTMSVVPVTLTATA